MNNRATEAMIMVISIAMACVGWIFGIIVGKSKTESKYQSLAIQHQAAHYNPTNAQFEWNK